MLTVIFENNDKPTKKVLTQYTYDTQDKNEHKYFFTKNFIVPQIGDSIILPLKDMIANPLDILPFKYKVIDRIVRYFFSSNSQTIILICEPDDSITIL